MNGVMWENGQILLGQYIIKRIFEDGGMGLVYQVGHLGWGIDLALKRPRDDFARTTGDLTAFEREIDTWAEIGLHPNVTTCHYSRRVDGRPCVFAEFVNGGSLQDWIRGRLLYRGEEEAVISRLLSIAVQFAWGLDWAHRHDLVHQDVKPGNVLLDQDGTAKVTDFGLARGLITSSKSRGVSHDTATCVGGTAAYASPEQAQELRLTRATDVWSWAVSVMQMFMGGICWHSGPVAAETLKLYNQQGRRAREMPEMPRELLTLLSNCLNRDPRQRPDSFERIADNMLQMHINLFGETCDIAKPDTDLVAVDALNNRAVSLMDVGRIAEAHIRLKRALHVDPNHPEAVCNYTLALYRDGRLSTSDGTQMLEGVLLNDVSDAHALKLLGLTLLEIGESVGAVRALTLASKVSLDQKIGREVEVLLKKIKQRGNSPTQHYFLAQPRTGAEFLADAARFDRLLTKAEAAVKEKRNNDARRYLQMAADIPGYARHPRAMKILQTM